jgi:predicted P-loop ATPase/GTPase
MAAACLVVLWLSYRSFKTPFFLYLLSAGLSLVGTAAVSCFNAWPPAEALADLGMASFGIVLAAAAHHLLISFRLAGEGHD